MSEQQRIGIAHGVPGYPPHAPYHPSEAYPEWADAAPEQSADANHAYAAVRTALAAAGLDSENFNTPSWNPFATFVRPGETVLIKPNFVRDFRETKVGDGDCLTTHGAVIRAVVDYVFHALRGRGRIVIADAPQNDADFDAVARRARLAELQAYYRAAHDFTLEVFDLRAERVEKVDGVAVQHTRLPGDPRGYRRVDLGDRSAFARLGAANGKLYGSEYDTDELRRQHSDGRNAYLLSQSVLDADVVINVPKLKTHKKCGLTVCLKNLVGINGNKNWLPHYRIGSARSGGDEFACDNSKAVVERAAMRAFRRWFPLLGPSRRFVAGPLKRVGKAVFGDTNNGTVRSGNWHGNDTVWRMVHDLNRILLYADAAGRVHSQPVRRVFSVVDGIVAGEGDGPLNADPRRAGLVLAGRNPVAVDLACARLVGFAPSKLAIIARAFETHPLPLVRGDHCDVEACHASYDSNTFMNGWPAWHLSFKPHFGWCGHVEADAEVVA